MSQIQTTNDPVLKPAHYTSGKIEVLDFIEDQKFNYKRACVVRYVSRAGKKDPAKELEDLRKAKFYLDREIEKMFALTVQLTKENHIMDAARYATGGITHVAGPNWTKRSKDKRSKAKRSAAARKAAKVRWAKPKSKKLSVSRSKPKRKVRKSRRS